MAALRTRWHSVSHGFWFVPGAIVTALAALALLLVRVDRSLDTDAVGVLYSGDASAASGILSTIAGATATIAGVVFSITIVTLQLVSSQFTPRALRGFLKDRLNQTTAGVFVGTFVYSLLVLRTIRSAENGGSEFVPALAVTTATLLGLLSLVVLIAFVHHVANSIQASTIAEKIGAETSAAIDRLYPEPYGDPEDDEEAEALLAAWREEAGRDVHATRAGYVQEVALDDLVAALAESEVRLHVVARPGDFVTPNDVVLSVWGSSVASEGLERTVANSVPIASARDTRDDVAFGLRQLSDVAVRALSPGMNDPTTARTCLGYLRGHLEELAARREPLAVRRFDEGVAVVARRSFADYLDEAFLEIAHHGASEPRVAHQLLTTLQSVAEAAAGARAWPRLAQVVELAEIVGARLVEEAALPREREILAGVLQSLREFARTSSAGADVAAAGARRAL